MLGVLPGNPLGRAEAGAEGVWYAQAAGGGGAHAARVAAAMVAAEP